MSFLPRRSVYPYLIIILIASFVLIPFIGRVHLFDWDEANFAEAAREMLVTKNWMRVQIDFLPFWEKPPFFIWLQALSMSAFGVNEFAARLPNAVIGIITLCSLFYIGKRVANASLAFWWTLIYVGTWLPHFYFKSGIIDPTFNLFIFLAFYQLWYAAKNSKRIHAVLSGFFLGLAVLTKGPAAILIAMLCCMMYIIISRGWGKLKVSYLLVIILSCAVTSFIWFGIDIIQNGWWFTKEFIVYQFRLLTTQDAGHGGPFYYHALILLIGCFPASLFLFQANRKNDPEKPFDADFSKWMLLLFTVTLVLFSIVKTKIVHYSSLCYLPLTYFAAREVSLIAAGKKKIKTITIVLLVAVTVILASLFIILPVAGLNIEAIKPYIEDPFFKANLEAGVTWSIGETMIGIIFLVSTLVTVFFIKRGKRYALIALFCTQVIFIETCILHFTPKIEKISQGAAISFYKSIRNKNAIVYPLDYKSYAYLFYSGKPSGTLDHEAPRLAWLLQHDIDKEVYFISRNVYKEKILEGNPRLELYKEENGYIILRLKR